MRNDRVHIGLGSHPGAAKHTSNPSSAIQKQKVPHQQKYYKNPNLPKLKNEGRKEGRCSARKDHFENKIYIQISCNAIQRKASMAGLLSLSRRLKQREKLVATRYLMYTAPPYSIYPLVYSIYS